MRIAMEDVIVHCPAMPVYEKLSSIDGIVHIGVPGDKPKKRLGLSRRDRALLVVAVKQGEVDLCDWSASDLAKLFEASPRSVSEAMRLSRQERHAVSNGDRPLFPRRPSAPAPTPVFDREAA
jgi:hypothetical protein